MQLYTMREAAERLSVTRKTLYVMHGRGLLAFVKVGRATRISAEELERFIGASTIGGKPELAQTGE